MVVNSSGRHLNGIRKKRFCILRIGVASGASWSFGSSCGCILTQAWRQPASWVEVCVFSLPCVLCIRCTGCRQLSLLMMKKDQDKEDETRDPQEEVGGQMMMMITRRMNLPQPMREDFPVLWGKPSEKSRNSGHNPLQNTNTPNTRMLGFGSLPARISLIATHTNNKTRRTKSNMPDLRWKEHKFQLLPWHTETKWSGNWDIPGRKATSYGLSLPNIWFALLDQPTKKTKYSEKWSSLNTEATLTNFC